MHPDLEDVAPGFQGSVDARSFAFEHLAAVAAVIDGDGVIVDTNAAWRLFASLNGGSVDSTGPGVSYLETCERSAAAGDESSGRIARGLRRVLAGEQTHFEFEYPCPTATEDRWFLLQASSAPVTNGSGAIVFHIDVTARKALRARLTFEAHHDELTGLPNRRSLIRRIESLRVRTGEGPDPSWLFLFDLDGFKTINDDHGHQIGDELLGLVAARAQRVVRKGDMVARLGGDEFVLVCEHLREADATALVERLRFSLAQPFQIRSLELTLGASIGLVRIDPAMTPTEALAAADHRMYEDKRCRPKFERTAATAATLPIAPTTDGAREAFSSPRSAPTNHGESEEKRVVAWAMTDAVVANSNDLVLFFAHDGTIKWVSRASEVILGTPPETLVGLNGFDLIHPSDRDRVLGDFMSIPNLHDHVRTEFRIVTPDGRVVWVDQIATNLLDEPNVGMVVGNIRDVTDRKRIEEAVRFQARLLDAVGEAVVAIDRRGAIIYWNEAAASLYGYGADEAMGHSLVDLLPPAEGWDTRSDEIQRQLARGEPWHGEIRILGRDGREIPLLVSDTPVFDDDGIHVATIGVGTDLTERIRSEEMSARLSAIVESSGDAVVSANLDGTIDTWNERACRLLDRSRRGFIDRSLVELFSSENRDVVTDAIRRVTAGAATGLVLRTADEDDEPVDLEVTFSPIRRSSDDTTIGISAIARDVTEHLRLYRRIEQERQRLAEAQRCARLGSFELDLDTGHSTRSEELCRILGVPVDSVGGADLEWVHPDDREMCADALRRIILGELDVEMTHRVVRPDGEVRWVISRTSDLGRGGHVICGTVLDITEQRVAQLALEYQATHDPLTGLVNRTGLGQFLSELLTRTRAQDRSLAVAMLDLDQFNQINDTLGHPVGDEVLQAVGDRLEHGLRDDDIIARFGGDEFVVIRSDVATTEQAEALGADIQRSLADEIGVGHRRFQVSCCVGIAISAADHGVDSLLSDADAAVHLAKRQGRAETAVLDPTSRAAAYRLNNLEAALTQAIDNDELRVEYQPVIDFGDDTTAGFEALLRWTSSRFGEVSPAEFIPIAEASGLIVAIGDWVLDRALAELANWRAAEAAGDIWLSVNVSARQLDRPEFVETVIDLVRSRGVPFHQLHLEVTESAVLRETETSSDTLATLRSHGIKVSIDDFGTGYSSLSYLDRLPIDILKIDRGFVRELHVSAERTAIVRTIVALADTLGLDTVAEGVENEFQARFLRELGCRHGQGFLWSPSLPAGEARAWIGRPASEHPAS